MAQARLREALTAGGPTTKERGPPVADGTLTVTPDTPEAVEWRSRRSIIDNIASCSSYLDEDDDGMSPGDLYGRFTWRIEKFSEVSKRELRSNTFEVGNYKWYILVYPQGCDVANHLSLFLCVADYDKLLPGWSHFAQFTIAVVNRDPKSSKYSDTLHRFCKKEHDWGWKKFMELGKVGEGFTPGDSLVIKAQVQVLRDRPHRPFFCLDAQYRRELTRVYLSNVEGIARRFVEERRAWLGRLLSGTGDLPGFWAGLAPAERFELSCDAAAPLLRAAVKRFFNEKEVTSTLVMDGLVAGCKALEAAGRAFIAGGRYEAPAGVLIDAVRGVFFFAGDALTVVEALVRDALPPPPPAPERSGGGEAGTAGVRATGEPDDVSRDGVERDERRLADLGRWVMETFAAAEIARVRLEAAWIEAETIKRQDALIREEELLSQEEQQRAAARSEVERERRVRKKEKQKKRREEERSRREADEAARAAADAARRAEAEAKAREAEERRRREEEAREEERARAAAEARAARARAKAAAAAAAAAVAAATPRPAPAGSGATSVSTSVATSAALAASPSALSTITTTSVDSDDGSAAGVVTSPPRADSPDPAGSGAAGGNRRPAPAAPRLRASPPSPVDSATTSDGSEGGARGGAALAAALARLAARDEEVAALRARVAELEARLAAQLSAPPSPSPPHHRAASGGDGEAVRARGGGAVHADGAPAAPSPLRDAGPGPGRRQSAPLAGQRAAGKPAATPASRAASTTRAAQHSAPGLQGGAGRKAGAGGAGAGGAPARPYAQAAGAVPNGVAAGAAATQTAFRSPAPAAQQAALSGAMAGLGIGGGGHLAGMLAGQATQSSAASATRPAAGAPPPAQHLFGAHAPLVASPHVFATPLASAGRSGGVPGAGATESKRVDAGPGLESPGLDDFAHMGLINDLLE